MTLYLYHYSNRSPHELHKIKQQLKQEGRKIIKVFYKPTDKNTPTFNYVLERR